MDDRMIALTQARMVRTAIVDAGLGVHDLWREYFRLGGEIDELEIDAYLYDALYLAPRHWDKLARAANYLVPGARIPYSRDLRPEERLPDS